MGLLVKGCVFRVTWLLCRVQVLLEERERADEARHSGWVEKLLSHKLTGRTAELEQSWGEVKFAWV